MYRKILFISVNLLENLSIFNKATLMLSFSFVSFLITYYSRPFLLKKMNVLELYSNLSSALTIYAGALYIMDVGDWLKAICFATVVLLNCIFSYFWISSMISIIFHAHFETREKFFPKITLKIFALIEALSRLKFSLNLCFYCSSLKELYSVVLKELKIPVEIDFNKSSKMMVTQC